MKAVFADISERTRQRNKDIAAHKRRERQQILALRDAVRIAGGTLRGVSGNPADAPVVLAWRPAFRYFSDPDGALLEIFNAAGRSRTRIRSRARWTHCRD